jgi:hypothetical protein
MEEEQRDKGREEPKTEEATAAEKTADQDRRKRLLTKIVELHWDSVKEYLKIYERYMEDRWDHADFDEREDFMEAVAGNVESYCKQFSRFMESGGWKDEEEVADEIRCNPMRSD